MLNVADGNLLVQVDDVDVPERGIDLAFRRTYNSQSHHDATGTDGSLPSAFGNGWTNTFDAHLAYNGTVMSVYDIDGARYDYAPNGSGGWTPPPGMQGVTLQWDGGCGYNWTKKTGTIYYFAEPTALSQCTATPPAAEFGRLQYIQGRNASNQITFTYSWSGNGSNPNQLTQVVAQHSDGDAMTLGFTLINGAPELASITRPDGLQVTYSYDGSGDLIGVERPGTGTISELPETYSYDAGSYAMAGAAGPRYTINYNACGSSTCVSDGDSVAFSYSGGALTMVQDYGVVNFTPEDGISPGLANGGLLEPGVLSGAQTWHTEEFSGDSTTAIGGSGGTTNVTDNFGHRRAWTYDGSARVTETQEWTSPTSSTPLVSNATWDTSNDLTGSVDVRGNQTNYTYDADGNTISVQAPTVQTSLGNGAPTSMYAYDAHNNLIAYCDPNYVWANHPLSCPATNGTTYYAYTTTANEPFGELTATYSPMGYSYALTYDNYGEPTLVQGTAMAQLDGTNRQPMQTFGYDPYGDLTSYNKGNGAWAVAYDNMHRPLTHTDPDGHVSYSYYNNDGSVNKTETPYQHANAWGSTVTYDADGDTVTETVIRQASTTSTPAPETTSKYYDGADRLIEVKQPQDTTHDTYTNPWMTRYLYDLAGTTNLNFDNAIDFAAYGNLYKTQELLPASSGPVTQTLSTPQSIANSTFEDLKGTAFDGLDRPVGKYSLVAANATSADAVSTETLTYDGTNEYGTFIGELTSDCNATSQCKYPGYDAMERADAIGFSDSTPSRMTQYDPDGHTTSITSSVYGTQSYTYDADGHKLTEQEASGGGVTSPATFSHVYYGDGKLAQLNITSSGFNQAGLFVYSYRADGLVQTQTINDAAQSNVGSTSVAFTYYPSGRAEERMESGPGSNPNPTTWQYDTYGRLSQVNYPACASCNSLNTSLGFSSYDPQGQILQDGYVTTNGLENGVAYTYTARGELANGTPGAIPTFPFYANGAQAPVFGSAYAQENYESLTTWDPFSGASLSKSTRVPGYNSATGLNYTTVTASSFSYDQVGRLTTEANSTEGGTIGNGNDTLSRSYDAEDHTITSSDGNTSTTGESGNLGSITAYNWGPTGHPIQIGSATGTTSAIPSLSSVQYDTLHWDGDQLVFQTNASGQVDDIKVGTSGDITPLDPSFTGLTFWDRGPGGAVVYCHNANGTGLSNISLWPTATVGLLGCGPSSMIWSSAPFAAGAGSLDRRPSYQVGVGQGGLLGMYRTDGMTDGLNTLQGPRTMDANAGTWTTPDAYAGDVADPASQKSYMWDNNNPVAYTDPSGYLTFNQQATLGAYLDLNSPQTQVPMPCTDYVLQVYKQSLDIDLAGMVQADYGKGITPLVRGYEPYGMRSTHPEEDVVNLEHYFQRFGELHPYTGTGNQVGDILFIRKDLPGNTAVDHVAMVASVTTNGAINSVVESTGTDLQQGTIEKSWADFSGAMSGLNLAIDGYGRVSNVPDSDAMASLGQGLGTTDGDGDSLIGGASGNYGGAPGGQRL